MTNEVSIVTIFKNGEIRSFEPSGGKENGSNDLEVRKLGDYFTVFNWGTEISFGSNYRRFEKPRVREIGILL